uniref:restriction endonuclease subunit S n=1 Tax=Listeria costaricensis TaxID=2026604 RepID=UPI000C08C978
WEQRKLGKLAEQFKSGINIKAENIYKTGKFPVYGGNGIRGYTNTYNHDGNFALIGRQGALSGNMNYSVGKAYFTEHAIAVKANRENDTKFLFYLMNKLKLGKWVTQSAQPGLAVGVITEIRTSIPNKNEQDKISHFFTHFDNTITLHQRKLDLLKQLKQGFLQQMFPQKEAKVPRVRFANFEGEWEQCKLEQVIEKQIKGKAHLEKLSKGNVEYLDASRLNGGKALFTNGVKNVEKNDILILWDGSKAGTVYTGFSGALGSTLKAYRTNIDSRFVYHFLKSQQKIIYENYRTPNIPHVQKDFLEIFEINISPLEEQQRIGLFFKQLDETLILYQLQIDKLKKCKTAFLQKMFI